MNKKISKWKFVVALYLLLWIVTGFIGLPQVDSAFDREFAMGSTGFSGPGNVEMPVERIEFFNARNPMNFPDFVPETPWKCRSRGMAIAPFFIIDEAAWHDHALSAFAGKRVVFWCFGYVWWTPLKIYWVS